MGIKKIFLIIGMLVAVLTAIIIMTIIIIENEKEVDENKRGDKVAQLVKQNNTQVSDDTSDLLKSRVEQDKYYRKLFNGAKKKVLANESVDREITTITNSIERDLENKMNTDNKDEITSGYLSALISLNELNKNNKDSKNKTGETNDILIKRINDNLAYSQREIYKSEIKAK